jgi:NAD(P)-dependent dehydrogenase (short-subunit alcohol dehydrogenase family)
MGSIFIHCLLLFPAGCCAHVTCGRGLSSAAGPSTNWCLCTKSPRLCLRQGANIVFISSYTAYHPEAPIAMYAISKTTLVALTKALAQELGPDGIRVNCVAPGWRPLSPLFCQRCMCAFHST